METWKFFYNKYTFTVLYFTVFHNNENEVNTKWQRETLTFICKTYGVEWETTSIFREINSVCATLKEFSQTDFLSIASRLFITDKLLAFPESLALKYNMLGMLQSRGEPMGSQRNEPWHYSLKLKNYLKWPTLFFYSKSSSFHFVVLFY